MTLADRWLNAAWSFVHAQLPPTPARVIELGCGRLGGLVPALHSAGYDAVGIDPQAPESPEYRRTEFETFKTLRRVDAVVASLSLHHVADLGDVVDRVAGALVPGGTLVVVEWAWERFDEPTARWCFARLPQPVPGGQGEPGWLEHHRDRWLESGGSWDSRFVEWVQEEGLHRGDEILRALDTRFDRIGLAEGPYFFSDLADTTEADEQAAIDAGEIQPTGLRYTGRLAATHRSR